MTSGVLTSGNLFRSKAYDLYHAELDDDDVLAKACLLKDTIYHMQEPTS